MAQMRYVEFPYAQLLQCVLQCIVYPLMLNYMFTLCLHYSLMSYHPLIADTPEQPVNVTVTEVTPFSVALAWVEPHNNNAPINDYIITIGSVGSSSTRVRANASVEAFNVTYLRPFVSYTFTVAAENDEGVGLASTPVIQCTSDFCE